MTELEKRLAQVNAGKGGLKSVPPSPGPKVSLPANPSSPE
jgi:hypothetical protein